MAKPKHSPAPAPAARHQPAAVVDGAEHEDLDELIARSERENTGLLQVLEQAQAAQRALAMAQKRIKAIEAKQGAEHSKEVGALRAERDTVRESAAAMLREHESVQDAVAAAAKAARALATSLLRLPDPLAPLTEEDDGEGFDKLRASLREIAERKDGGAGMVADVASRARVLVDAAAARVSQQANRIKLLRKHVDQLQADGEAAAKQIEELHRSGQARDAETKAAAARLKETQATILGLRKDLESTGTRLDRTTKSSLEGEAKALKERETLISEQKIAKSRADDLGKRLAEARKQLRGAERMAADLAQALLDAGDEMLAAGDIADAPAVKGARGELEELVTNLAEAVEDDLEAALREDLCDDLVPTARALVDVLVSRHKCLHEEMETLRKAHAKLALRHETAAAALEQERQAGKTTKTELVRSLAQLKASQHEFEQTAKELASRQRELGEAKGELARLSTEAQGLTAQAVQAKTMRAEFDVAKGELEQSRKAAVKNAGIMQHCEDGLQGLGKALVDLASATESALAAAGQRSEGFVGRFTRTMRKLEGETGKQQGDLLSLLRMSTEMVDKATTRIGQLQAELTRRGEALAKAEAEGAALTKERDELSRSSAKHEADLRATREERDELAKTAKRVGELEPALARREEELALAKTSVQELQAGIKQVRSEFDEVKAREAAAVDSLQEALASARKRLDDEQQAHRATEAACAELREEAEARTATIDAKTQELERAIEARDGRIGALQKEVSNAAESRGRAADAQRRAEGLNGQLAKANERIRALEAQLEEAEANEQVSKDLTAVRAERDELATRLRAFEKRLADERGAAASAKAQVESLKGRLDERAVAHRQAAEKIQERCDSLAEENRRLKEQLAGLNARVRTLTAH